MYQGSTLASATFSGTVLSFDSVKNILKVINTNGSLIVNKSIIGSKSSVSKVVLSYTPPDFVPLSGYITYIENRSPVQRSTDGIEQFRFILGY